MIQTAADVFLGYRDRSGVPDGTYYVRQLWDVKGSFDPTRMDLATVTRYAGLCAWVLARAHSRTGDAASISDYMGKGHGFDRAVAEFAGDLRRPERRRPRRCRQAIADGVLPSSSYGTTGRRRWR